MKLFDVRTFVMIAMFSAIAFILNTIKIITMPYGGNVSCCSMMPIMLLAILLGNRAGMLGGLVFGCLSIVNGAYVIHPIQFMLDYIIPSMLLGMAGCWGYQHKGKMLLGALLAVMLNVGCHIISGGIYFGMYAPEGMNPWIYSVIYNLLTSGVEGFLSTVLLMFIPIHRFARIIAK